MLSASVASKSRHGCLGCLGCGSSSLQSGFFWEMVEENHKPVPARGRGCRDTPCMERGQELPLLSGDREAKPRVVRMGVQQDGDLPQLFGKHENGAKLGPGAEGKGVTLFLPWRGHGRGPAQGRAAATRAGRKRQLK